jgi:hypothetical protein
MMADYIRQFENLSEFKRYYAKDILIRKKNIRIERYDGYAFVFDYACFNSELNCYESSPYISVPDSWSDDQILMELDKVKKIEWENFKEVYKKLKSGEYHWETIKSTMKGDQK